MRLFNRFLLLVFALFVLCTYVALSLIGSDPNAVVDVDIMTLLTFTFIVLYLCYTVALMHCRHQS